MPKTSSRGFTLVELLIVVIIIAILAAFAYPAYLSVQERARVTQDMNNLRQIGLGTQRYLTDNDNVLFLTANTWMSQLLPKYLPAWSIFQSGFDKRTPSELGDATTPVSYGINFNIADRQDIDRISNPSVFILFAPAQATGTSVSFQGTPVNPGTRGVNVNRAATTPAGPATGGTNIRRKRISALCADLHAENMLWSAFIEPANSNTTATQRWSP